MTHPHQAPNPGQNVGAALESVEIECWSDALAALPVRQRSALGLRTVRNEAGVALVAAGVDHPLFNRVFLPRDEDVFAGTSRAAALAELLGVHSAAGVTHYFVHLPEALAHRGHDALRAVGLHRYRRDWIKLAAPREALVSDSPAVAADIVIGPLSSSQASAFSQLMCTGFALPDSARPIFESLVGRARWHLWGASTAGQLISAGALFVNGTTAYLAGGVTANDHRSRGIHAAVVSARVAEALHLGCQWVTSETGAALTGETQHSEANMSRCGLTQTEVRRNYVAPGAGWGLDHD